MRRIITLLFAVGLGCSKCVLTGCGKSDNHLISTSAKNSSDEAPLCTAASFVSAEDVVDAQLEKMGLHEGYDKSRGLMITVASRETELNDREKFNEAFRQVAFRKTMVDAAGEIARACEEGGFETEEPKDEKGDVVSSTLRFRGKMNLQGLTVLLSAESYDTAACIYQQAIINKQSLLCGQRNLRRNQRRSSPKRQVLLRRAWDRNLLWSGLTDMRHRWAQELLWIMLAIGG